VILLDTNVISELTRSRPDPRVLAWADGLDHQEAVKAELLTGRIWPFSSVSAHWYGELVSHRDRLGLPIDTADAVIAAIALEHGAQLATHNTKDFTELGLVLINPWNR
jgi:predicted nucleic acid-binding protein